MKRLLLLVFTCLGLAGCAHTLTLVDFQKGETVLGKYTDGGGVTVTMPSGEVLSGKYSVVDNARFTFATATAVAGGQVAAGSATGITTGGSGQAYALLRSPTSRLMMEIIATYGSSGHGFGEARTNDGRVFRVQF